MQAAQRHRGLIARLAERDKRQEQINSRALLLVALGIIIVSLPDELASHSWLAAVAIVAALAFSALGAYWIWRDLRAARAAEQ